MTSLSLASGSGDDGVLPEEVTRSNKEPITQMVRVRVAHAQNSGARQVTEEGGCVELERMWVEFNSTASATATNLNNPINEAPANNTQNILEAICARNLTADLSSCTKESGARQTTILLIIRIR